MKRLLRNRLYIVTFIKDNVPYKKIIGCNIRAIRFFEKVAEALNEIIEVTIIKK